LRARRRSREQHRSGQQDETELKSRSQPFPRPTAWDE